MQRTIRDHVESKAFDGVLPVMSFLPTREHLIFALMMDPRFCTRQIVMQVHNDHVAAKGSWKGYIEASLITTAIYMATSMIGT